jgi:hypothetical protein
MPSFGSDLTHNTEIVKFLVECSDASRGEFFLSRLAKKRDLEHKMLDVWREAVENEGDLRSVEMIRNYLKGGR